MASTVLGKVTCVPRGDYNAATEYTVLDIVGYQGGSYMALATITGVEPSNDGVNWMQLSGPGLPGGTGPQGEPGAAAGFGSATATIDDTTGTPDVSVELSGPDTAKVFAFSFSGLKGETGAKGDTGDKGDTGATGPQGVSVTNAEIDGSGHLIITLSAGEPIDAGNAVGPTGATGPTGETGPEGASVDRIERTAGTGAPGTTDTYTVYLTDGSTGGTFNVYNGSNGTGSGDFMADGSVPMSGNLQMGGNKITNLGAPGADTDAVRKQDLDAVAAEVDGILDGTTPAHLAPATTVKIGGVIVGDGLSVEADGTVSANSQLPEGGTNGQILTKTANGETWADPPDTGVTAFNERTGAVVPKAGDYTAEMVGALAAPEGGTEGQMLYKSADGVEWGDKPVMYVNITHDSSSGYAADKTASEIYEAYSNGNAIFAIYGTAIIGLRGVSASDGMHNATFLSTEHTEVIVIVVMGSSETSYVVVSSSPISPDAVNVNFTPASALTSDNVQDAIAEVQGNVDAAKPVLRTATLTTSGWSGNSQTVTVSGVVADTNAQLITVSPANKASATAWGEAGVFCSGQGANSLTFVCDSTPSASINVNISIQEAQT